MAAGRVLAGFFRSQIAGLLHPGEIQAGGGEFRDFGAFAAADCHLEDVRSDQLARGALVHGEETVPNPVPAVIVVGVVDADPDLHLRLSPEAGTVGRAQPDAGIEVGGGVLAIGADQFDARLVLRVLAQVVVRQQLKADRLGGGHLIFGTELDPPSAGADAVIFLRIRAPGAALGAGR
jgi:hypothetical protein